MAYTYQIRNSICSNDTQLKVPDSTRFRLIGIRARVQITKSPNDGSKNSRPDGRERNKRLRRTAGKPAGRRKTDQRASPPLGVSYRAVGIFRCARVLLPVARQTERRNSKTSKVAVDVAVLDIWQRVSHTGPATVWHTR